MNADRDSAREFLNRVAGASPPRENILRDRRRELAAEDLVVPAFVQGESSAEREAFRQQLGAKGRESFYFFTKGVLGKDRLVEHLHKPLCDFLQDPIEPKKVVMMPRGHFKTTVATEAFALWLLVCDPEETILIVSHTMTYSMKILRAIKSVFEKNTLFRWLYPEIIPDLKQTKWSETEIIIPRKSEGVKESSIEVLGVGGSSVGSHFRTKLEDDLVDEDNLVSADQMNKVIDWHKYSLSLLREPGSDREVVSGTRWGFHDLLHHVLENEKDFVVFERSVGDDNATIFPEMFPQDALDKIRSRQGPYIFGCQYRNRPTDPARQIFRPEWLQEVTWDDTLLKLTDDWNAYAILDPALSEKRDGSFNGYVLALVGPRYETVIVEGIKRRWSVENMIERVFADLARFPRLTIAVEGQSGWKLLKYPFERAMIDRGVWPMFHMLTPNNQLSKEGRIRTLQPLFASLRFKFVRGACADLLADVIAFPFGDGKYDALDALAYLPHVWAEGGVAAPARPPALPENDPWNMAGVMAELHKRGARGYEYPFTRHAAANAVGVGIN